MDHAVVGGIVNNLPIDKMVSAPLIAAIKAQTDMSMALAHFVKDVGIDENGQVRMVTFNYQENVLGTDGNIHAQERHIEAPFLSLTGIPNLAIEDVHISFDLEVSTAEDDTSKNQEDAAVETEYKSWWSPVSAKFTGNVTHSSSQTRHTDTRAKYTFNVSARKQDAPEGFMRILDAITNSAATPHPESKESNLLPSGNTGGTSHSGGTSGETSGGGAEPTQE